MREHGEIFPRALLPQSYRIERRMFGLDCLNAPRLSGQQTRHGFQLLIFSQLLLPILSPRFQLIRKVPGFIDEILSEEQIATTHGRTKSPLKNLHHTIHKTVLIDTAEPEIH